MARFAVVLPAVYYLVNLILQRVERRTSCAPSATSSGWTGTTPSTASRRRPITARAPSAPLGLLVGVVTVAAVVVACIWQHRAASAGRALGIPSRHSPAWGVGPGSCRSSTLDALRRRARLPPAGRPPPGPGAALVDRLARWPPSWQRPAPCALFSTGAALVLSVPAALACLAVIAWAPGIVMAIAAAHREAMAARPRQTGRSGLRPDAPVRGDAGRDTPNV